MDKEPKCCGREQLHPMLNFWLLDNSREILSRNFHPKIQNFGLKPPMLGTFKAKLKFWAAKITLVENLQRSAPPTLLTPLQIKSKQEQFQTKPTSVSHCMQWPAEKQRWRTCRVGKHICCYLDTVEARLSPCLAPALAVLVAPSCLTLGHGPEATKMCPLHSHQIPNITSIIWHYKRAKRFY